MLIWKDTKNEFILTWSLLQISVETELVRKYFHYDYCLNEFSLNADLKRHKNPRMVRDFLWILFFKLSFPLKISVQNGSTWFAPIGLPLIQSNLKLGLVSICVLKASNFYFSFPYFTMSISRVRDGKGNSFLNGNGTGRESRSSLQLGHLDHSSWDYHQQTWSLLPEAQTGSYWPQGTWSAQK